MMSERRQDGGVPTADLRVDPDRDGWTRLHQAWATPVMRREHRHDELEVNLVLQGWADYLIVGRRVRFARHGLGWLLPGEVHRLIGQSGDLRMWIGVFRPTLFPTDEAPSGDTGPPLGWRRQAADETLTRVLNTTECAGLAKLFGQLADDRISAKRHRIGLAWLLSECWRAYQLAAATPAGADLHPAVEAAAQWLYDHAGDLEANDLDALAARCGVSRPWLSTLFQQQLGDSITDFRNKQRLRRFRELIAHPEGTSMTEASFAAGFGSYAQCYRTIRRYTGRSPRELMATDG